MSTSVPTLAAESLVRNERWEKIVVFYTDPEKTAVYDLSALDVTASIRWEDGEQAVTVEVTDPEGGQATFSLAAEETLAMPLGQIPTLFIAVDTETWARAPVDVLEGLFVPEEEE